MSAFPESTSFSRDVIGRYVCNTMDEALRSMDRSVRPEARPFDIIVIGGGTFGAVIAQHLFWRDKAHSHRILVLEGGPVFAPEHVQNLPMLGVNAAGATSIAELRSLGQDGLPRNEVWGLAWHSDVKFPGLAYCVGGRSLFWGGWSPQLLETEMRPDRWPAPVSADLNGTYFRQAGEQIGVTETNDFIFGDLHEAMRNKLFSGFAGVTGAINLADLPLHLDGVPAGQEDLFKLEAPLAVQTRTRSGFFPINKFSAFPLLMKAARAAQVESGGDDVRKRLMVVPYCHVKSLEVATSSGPSKVSSTGQPLDLSSRTVTSVTTNLGSIPVPPGGIVVVALGTIESTRLALRSFRGGPHADLIGRNLMAHLRSNLTIRVPREALGISPATRELQASALFVKGRHRHADGTSG
ncbi:MAG TPA: hypothetical protein VFU23_04540, partial [Gemmatimonadales bacterium]|nr:hypothetical protein [Gemmatimonadales bacterium]